MSRNLSEATGQEGRTDIRPFLFYHETTVRRYQEARTNKEKQK